MNKPDWEYAPEWASYLTQDRNGSWWWFEHKPFTKNGIWRSEKGNMESAATISTNWKNSLEERPK